MELDNHHPISDVDMDQLLKAVGKKVEVVAFNLAYSGRLKSIDSERGRIRIEDGGDYVVLEIERLESFRLLEG